MPGPLDGITIIELSAIGPVPFGVMLLADLGADVVRIDRVAAAKGNPGTEASMFGLSRGRRSIAVDLKSEAGRDVVLRLVDGADVFVEGFRPGVVERLGLGPDTVLDRNPRVVYGRMTGWGQTGPLSQTAGHDINYAALAGALHPVGRRDTPPPPPLNYLADFGGGGAYLALGILAALVERAGSGRGQVVDAAMVDGAASLTAFFHGLSHLGMWRDDREANLLDGGSPIYDCYETADGRYVAVGAIEPQFQMALAEGLGFSAEDWWARMADPSALKEALRTVFRTRTRDEWGEHFAGTDACVTPVLTLSEAPSAPENRERGVFVEVDGFPQPAPAPRLSRTPGEVRSGAPGYGAHTDDVLAAAGFDEAELVALREAGTIA